MVLCAMLLIRGASESAKVNAIMVVISPVPVSAVPAAVAGEAAAGS